MKKQSMLLKGVAIVFTFCITTLIVSSGQSSTENSRGTSFSRHPIDLPGSSIFIIAGNTGDLKQTITTGSDLSQRNLLAGSSPLVSACMFVRKILHYQ